MVTVWLHRLAVVVAASTLLLLVAGGLVTSSDTALSIPDWPFSPGRFLPSAAGGQAFEYAHRWLAIAVGLMTVVLASGILALERRRWLKVLGLVAVLAVVAQGVLGAFAVELLTPWGVSVAHATLAHSFFALTVAIALFTSAGWDRAAEKAPDPGRPSLPLVAALASAGLFGQVALGTALRHGAIGVVLHVAVAAVALLLVSWAVFRVLSRHIGHSALRRAALAAVSLTFSQFLIGMGAYAGRIAALGAPQPMPLETWFTVAHVAAGALSLGACVALAITVFRYVGRSRSGPLPGGVAVA